MARKSKMSVLKRQREMRKAEKAARKREEREQRAAETTAGGEVASADDLAAYGFTPSEDEEEEGERG